MHDTQSPNRNTEHKQSARRQQESMVNMRPTLLSQLLFILILGFAFYTLIEAFRGPDGPAIPYTQFKQEVAQGKVEEVRMDGQELTGQYRGDGAADESEEPESGTFHTTLPPVDDPRLISLLEENNVTVRAVAQQSGFWVQALVFSLPWILLLGLIFYASRSMSQQMSGGGPGGIFHFGRSKAKKYHHGQSDTTFEDVAGLENAKRDLKEIVDYLKSPDRYQRLGAKLPRGILLVGQPGTGKTLLAKACAGEAQVPFYSISGSEFIEMFVGVGASRVRDMFENAKREAPSVIFIDELDSVGRNRGTGLGGGHDEREQTLNQILSEMDGFAPDTGVVVLAATNRPDVLDPALMRPGRFDRKVALELPRREARRRILDVHVRGIRLADDVDLDAIARRTVGFSGADLENLINEAALLAGRDGKERVDRTAFEKAREKIVFGAERESWLQEEEKRRVGFHEAGHALLACLLTNTDPIDKVTIIPRGRALGATEQLPGEERYNLTESYLRDRITVMLGGRVSERLIFGETSSGAEDDLLQATKLGRWMTSRWGMSETLGPVAFRRDEEHVFLGREMTQPRDFSEKTAQWIDEEIRALLLDLEEKASSLLQEHRTELESLAEALLDKEVLEATEIQEIVECKTGRETGNRELATREP